LQSETSDSCNQKQVIIAIRNKW